MDTGLKRLWTRRKSKGNDSRKDSGVSSLRKSQSTDQTQQSITTSPRSNHVRSVSTDHGKPQFSPATSNRVQPRLSGGVVSRPSTSWSRTGTDGSSSLLNAVNRAADAVAKAGQEYKYSADRYTKDHIRPKTPRYIDIFSLSTSNSPKLRPGYNEDVAERNLDLARVALEGTQHQYVPSSKYQEEVAARNAFPTLPGDPATSSSVNQGVFNGGQSPSQVRGIFGPMSNHSQSPQKSEDRSFSRQTQNIHDSMRSHSRQQSDRSGGSQHHFYELPAPTESVENSPYTQTSASPVAWASGSHDPLTASTSPEVPLRHPRRQSGEFHYSRAFAAHALGSYQLSASEVTRLKSADPSLYSPSHDYSIRPPSNPSNQSAVKRAINLPNRTIMDLTGDDPEVFAEIAPPSNNNSPPALEHAKVDTMRRVQGYVISGPTKDNRPTQSNPSQLKILSPANTESPRGSELSQPREPLPKPVSEPPRSKAPVADAHFTSSFTPIITIASASPRASVILEKPTVADDTMVNLPSSDVVESQNSQGQARLTTDLSNHNRDRPLDKKAHTAEISVATSENKEAGTSVDTTLQREQGTGSAELEPTITRPSQPERDDEPLPSIQPYILLSSGNLKSTDTASVSRTSGVSTRDFANSTTKSTLTSVPEDAELNGNGDVKRSAGITTWMAPENTGPGDRSTYRKGQPAPIPLYKSTFDEAGFAQKQAEARDALIRLQLSLNESFLKQSPSAAIASSATSSPSKHAYSFSDGRPAAPSSLFAQVRKTAPDPVNSRSEFNNAIGAGRSDTSYHHLTTMPQDNMPAHWTTTRDSPEKGKQRAEIELNGPGPSIVNDEPKQPLPLPPPLHLSGHPFHQRLHETQPAVPPSPGEISLSNFPIPVSSPRQSVQRPPLTISPEKQQGTRPSSQNARQHSYPSSTPGMKERILRRQSSQRSQASSTSVFSIPYHMIPDRSSSIRDRSVMDDADD